MRHRVVLLAAVAAAAGVAGCSGSTATLPSAASPAQVSPGEGVAQAVPEAAAATPKPTAKPTATPTPKPTPAVYPLQNGDQFTYSFAYRKDTIVGSTDTYIELNATLTSVVSGPTAYNGTPVYELRSTGRTGSGSTVPATLDYVDYVNLIQSGNHTEYVDYGYDHADSLERSNIVTEYDDTKQTYATPFVNDVLPESTGSAWAEPIAAKKTVHDYDQTPQISPNILSGTETISADGSYYGSGMNYDVAETRLLRADGTGYVVDGPPTGATQWAYGLPEKDKAGKEVIPATESYDGKTGTSNLVPDWYPGGGAPANPLASETMRDLGPTKAPAECDKLAGTVATRLESIYSQLDPILGITETEGIENFVVPGKGTICTIDQNLENDYNAENTGRLTKTVKTSTVWVLLSEVLK
jgi:hypothetical protein